MCILTNVGLLYYDEPDDKKPSNLFPTIDATIKEVPESRYSKPYVFSIKSYSFEVILAAKNKDDYERWLKALKRLQDETEVKKREIARKHQI